MADVNNNFRKLKVPDLKAILKRKGISCTDKRKDELLLLVERADGVYENLEADDREASERKRRCVKVTDSQGVTADIQLSGKKVTWSDDLSSVPLLRDGNVFAYLMHHCQWGWERINAYEQDDGYRMFLDHHVEKIKVGKIADHDKHQYVEGTVRPEQRQTDARYDTWILVSSDALVESAGCQCVAADDGTCKHVVCLLFTLSDMCQKRRDRNPETCTDVAMVWNKPRKESVPVKAIELDYRHDKDLAKKNRPIPEEFLPCRGIDVNRIQDELSALCRKEKPDCLFLTLVDAAPPKRAIPSIPDLAAKFKADSPNGEFLRYLLENITVVEVDDLKILSQGSPQWHDARKGRITASIGHDVFRLQSGSSVIEKILGNSPPFTTAATQHGQSYEKVARAQYLKQQKTRHKNLQVDECGFYICQDAPYLGASPDGLVFCDCHGSHLLEIKCPYKHRNIEPMNIPPNDKSYHVELCDGALNLKVTSSWFHQVQFQMGITGHKLCHVVIFTLKGMELIEVDFDEDLWKRMKHKCTKVYKERIIPKLIN